jgi:hypothetical protein
MPDALPILIDHRNEIWRGMQVMNLPIMQFLHVSVPCFLFGRNIFLSTLFSSLNPLKWKRRLLCLKTQFVPRSKHLSSRL